MLQIDSSLLQAGEPSTFEKRHWVVVDPHRQPMARRGAGTPMAPLSEVAKAVWAVPKDQLLQGLKGHHMADWETDLSVASWGNERYRVYSAKLGRLIGRVYGGYAFARFK